MQQLHQGQPQQSGWAGNGWNGQNQNSVMSSVYTPHSQGYNGAHSTNAADDLISGGKREADDIDEIIRMAEAGIKPPKKGEAASAPIQAPPPSLPQAPVVPGAAPVSESTSNTTDSIAEKTEAVEKKAKKEMKMVYDDLEVSPEEKMALLPRFAFVPEGKTEPKIADQVPVATVGA
jgi:hypothetical protein